MTEDANRLNAAALSAMVLDKVGLGAILLAYAVVLGTAYLFAFWRTMGFDIFPYLSVQNYITAPLNRMSVLVATPALLAVIAFGRTTASMNSHVRYISLYLLVLYFILFVVQQYEAISRFLQYGFNFPNEKNVLILATILFLGSLVLAYRLYRGRSSIYPQVVALVLVQIAIAISAGYSDGKVIYNGADQVYFLTNKEVCETESVRDWVYLGKFGDQTFFINTIDKRICISGETDFKLVSRMYKEGH